MARINTRGVVEVPAPCTRPYSVGGGGGPNVEDPRLRFFGHSRSAFLLRLSPPTGACFAQTRACAKLFRTQAAIVLRGTSANDRGGLFYVSPAQAGADHCGVLWLLAACGTPRSATYLGARVLACTLAGALVGAVASGASFAACRARKFWSTRR